MTVATVCTCGEPESHARGACPMDTPLEHVPGQCSEHPGLELVKHRRLRLRWHNYVTDPATCCPSPDHLAADLERCRWCGGPLNVAGAIFRLSPRREYCTDLHRLHAFRARARAARSAAAS